MAHKVVHTTRKIRSGVESNPDLVDVTRKYVIIRLEVILQ